MSQCSEKQGQACKSESVRRIQAQPKRVQDVNADQNVACIEQLTEEFGLPDKTLHSDCTVGYQAFGSIMPSGWWGPSPSNPSCADTDGEFLFRDKHIWVQNPPSCATKHSHFMLQAAYDKVNRGGALGPFQGHQVPYARFNPHRRFVVEQPTGKELERKRCVDDPKRRGENERTVLNEKMVMRGFEGLVDLLIFMAKHGSDDALSPRLAFSLEVLLSLLSHARPRIIRPSEQRRLCVLYFDNCGNPETLAGILLEPGSKGSFFSTRPAAAEKYLDPSSQGFRNTQ